MKACLLSSILLIFLTALPLHAEEETSLPDQAAEEGSSALMNSGGYINKFGQALGTVTRKTGRDQAAQTRASRRRNSRGNSSRE